MSTRMNTETKIIFRYLVNNQSILRDIVAMATNSPYEQFKFRVEQWLEKHITSLTEAEVNSWLVDLLWHAACRVDIRALQRALVRYEPI